MHSTFQVLTWMVPSSWLRKCDASGKIWAMMSHDCWIELQLPNHKSLVWTVHQSFPEANMLGSTNRKKAQATWFSSISQIVFSCIITLGLGEKSLTHCRECEFTQEDRFNPRSSAPLPVEHRCAEFAFNKFVEWVFEILPEILTSSFVLSPTLYFSPLLPLLVLCLFLSLSLFLPLPALFSPHLLMPTPPLSLLPLPPPCLLQVLW